ncbi:hypothetical protein JOM56_001541 [Amanita muscaria]
MWQAVSKANSHQEHGQKALMSTALRTTRKQPVIRRIFQSPDRPTCSDTSPIYFRHIPTISDDFYCYITRLMRQTPPIDAICLFKQSDLIYHRIAQVAPYLSLSAPPRDHSLELRLYCVRQPVWSRNIAIIAIAQPLPKIGHTATFRTYQHYFRLDSDAIGSIPTPTIPDMEGSIGDCVPSVPDTFPILRRSHRWSIRSLGHVE